MDSTGLLVFRFRYILFRIVNRYMDLTRSFRRPILSLRMFDRGMFARRARRRAQADNIRQHQGIIVTVGPDENVGQPPALEPSCRPAGTTEMILPLLSRLEGVILPPPLLYLSFNIRPLSLRRIPCRAPPHCERPRQGFPERDPARPPGDSGGGGRGSRCEPAHGSPCIPESMSCAHCSQTIYRTNGAT